MIGVHDVPYLVAVTTIFDPDEYELRWPPQLFVDEANRLRRPEGRPLDDALGIDRTDWAPAMQWLLTEALCPPCRQRH